MSCIALPVADRVSKEASFNRDAFSMNVKDAGIILREAEVGMATEFEPLQ